jgi:hypothetical protein
MKKVFLLKLFHINRGMYLQIQRCINNNFLGLVILKFYSSFEAEVSRLTFAPDVWEVDINFRAVDIKFWEVNSKIAKTGGGKQCMATARRPIRTRYVTYLWDNISYSSFCVIVEKIWFTKILKMPSRICSQLSNLAEWLGTEKLYQSRYEISSLEYDMSYGRFWWIWVTRFVRVYMNVFKTRLNTL